MFIVGLTGGIGCGKSTAATFLNELGVTVVDADTIARQVVEPGEPCLQQIAAHFGNDVLHADGALNRTALRQIIFSQPEQKQWLESLMHPVIYQRAQDALHSAQGDYVVYMSPLLLESQQQNWCHHIVVVDLPVELQVERASARDHANSDDIRRIINTQISRKDRLANADHIIDNSGSLIELKSRTIAMHHTLQTLAKAHSQLQN